MREYIGRHEARPQHSTDRIANARRATQYIQQQHKGQHRPERQS